MGGERGGSRGDGGSKRETGAVSRSSRPRSREDGGTSTKSEKRGRQIGSAIGGAVGGLPGAIAGGLIGGVVGGRRGASSGRKEWTGSGPRVREGGIFGGLAGGGGGIDINARPGENRGSDPANLDPVAAAVQQAVQSQIAAKKPKPFDPYARDPNTGMPMGGMFAPGFLPDWAQDDYDPWALPPVPAWYRGT